MATNVPIDEQLLAEARTLGGHRTNSATITEALREYIRRRKQLRIVELFATIDYERTYDYKKQRRKR
jgi:Arc/MetJ family transcription regulator